MHARHRATGDTAKSKLVASVLVVMARWALLLVALVVASAKVEDVVYLNMKDHNAEALSMLLDLHRSDLGWTHVTSKDGVEVKKRFLPAGSFVGASDAAAGSKHACVRATAVVDAPVDKVRHRSISSTLLIHSPHFLLSTLGLQAVPEQRACE